MRRNFWLVALTLNLIVGCAPKASSPLENAARWARAKSPCRESIPLDWAASFPVPTDDPGGKKFFVFFYPIDGVPPQPAIVHEPGAQATLDIDSQAPVDCRLYSESPKALAGRRWPTAIYKMSHEKASAEASKLIDAIEKVGGLYASKRTLEKRDISLTVEMITAFDANSEPALRPYYYRLNPAFWEWLRSTAGRSIPKS